MYDLYIGNKNYSSWSLRPWLLMQHFGIPFREHLVSVAGRPFNPALKPLAGNGRVPCLHEADGFQVWDSLAIIETLAEREPAIWPGEARSQCAQDDGPWLFGAFTAADAMFAPIACRFDTYNVPLPPLAAAYRDTVLAHPALLAWRAAALQECEAHAHYANLAEAY